MEELNNIPPQNDSLSIKKYLYLFLSNWYWLLLSLAVGLFVGYLINRYTHPFYETSASLIYESDINTNTASFFSGLPYYARRSSMVDVQNEITKLQSYSLTRRTLEKLDFNVSYLGYGRIKTQNMYNDADIRVEIDTTDHNTYNVPVIVNIIDKNKYELSVPDMEIEDTLLYFGQKYRTGSFSFSIHLRDPLPRFKKYSFILHEMNQLTNEYRSKLKFTTDETNNSKIIVQIRGNIPEKIVIFLNQFLAEYLLYSLEQKIIKSEKTLDFVEEQVAMIEDSLDLIEKRIIRYKLQQDVVDVNLESDMALGKYRAFQGERTTLEFKQKYYNYIRERFKTETDPRQLITPSMAGIDEPMLSDLILEFKNLYTQKMEMSSLVKKDFPGTFSHQTQMVQLKDLIQDKVQGIMESNTESLLWINQEINAAKNELRDLPVSEGDYLKLERTYELYNKYYAFLLERRAEGGIQKASQIPDSKVLDAAREENAKKLRPNKQTNLLYAGLIGLLIPIAILFLLDFTDNKIKSKEDIEYNTHVPILGLLGHNLKDSYLPVFEDPRSKLSEGFRRIRTDMKFLLHEPGDKTILVTSAISGEGKTFIAINLAIITAMSNNKVLLLGMDMRKPNFHKIFNVSNRKGMSSFLIGKDSYEDVMKETNISNLFLIPSGPPPPNPVELMETPRMQEFMERVNREFDYVFIDTPPLAIVTDAQIMGKYSSLNIFVLRQKYSHKDALDFINKLKHEGKFRQMNIVVNDMEPGLALGYRYNYGYSYSYGYGYHYKYKDDYYYSDENDDK